MKKALVALVFIMALNYSARAMQSDTIIVAQSGETEQVVEEEPPTSSKVILFMMTAVGVILIGIAVRNSKFGKKRR
ncbi:MAG: hypothetical protein ABJG41_09820 [Cyclobacteriaceae bacterium]